MKDVDILNIQGDLIHLPGTFDNEEIYWFFFSTEMPDSVLYDRKQLFNFYWFSLSKKKSFLLTLWKDT